MNFTIIQFSLILAIIASIYFIAKMIKCFASKEDGEFWRGLEAIPALIIIWGVFWGITGIYNGHVILVTIIVLIIISVWAIIYFRK